MRLFLVLALMSFSAFATDWSDLEVESTYKLSQSIQLKQIERSGSLLDIVKGEPLLLKAIVPVSVPGFPLLLYIFDLKSCPGPKMTTDQEIIPVQGTNPLVEVGVQLDTDCELNMYVEMKDYYSQALFE
jgi:hypothetical protein